MSTFTTIASLQRLTDRELDILFRSVNERLARSRRHAGEPRSAGDAGPDPPRDRAAPGALAEAGVSPALLATRPPIPSEKVRMFLGWRQGRRSVKYAPRPAQFAAAMSRTTAK